MASKKENYWAKEKLQDIWSYIKSLHILRRAVPLLILIGTLIFQVKVLPNSKKNTDYYWLYFTLNSVIQVIASAKILQKNTLSRESFNSVLLYLMSIGQKVKSIRERDGNDIEAESNLDHNLTSIEEYLSLAVLEWKSVDEWRFRRGYKNLTVVKSEIAELLDNAIEKDK